MATSFRNRHSRLTAPRGFRTSHTEHPRKENAHRTAPVCRGRHIRVPWDLAVSDGPGLDVSIAPPPINTGNLTTDTNLVLGGLSPKLSILRTASETCSRLCVRLWCPYENVCTNRSHTCQFCRKSWAPYPGPHFPIERLPRLQA